MSYEVFASLIQDLCERKGLTIWEMKHIDDKYDPDYGKQIARLSSGYTILGNSVATSVEFRNRNHRMYATLDMLRSAV